MLTIRKPQMAILENAAIRAFEDRTYAHLQQYFPGHCRLLGEPQMRRAIRYGWEKSRSYGFTAECCVRTYIEFMCLLGGGFDTDPLLPWAAQILNDTSDPDQVARGDRFYERAWEYIGHIVPDYRDATGKAITARFVGDLKQLRNAPDGALGPHNFASFSRVLMTRLEQVFPAKCRYVGQERVHGLIQGGIAAAAGHGITGERGVTIFVALMFVLGNGFDRDPLMPWASATLNDASLRDPKKKIDKLYLKALSVLGRWWDSAHQPRA